LIPSTIESAPPCWLFESPHGSWSVCVWSKVEDGEATRHGPYFAGLEESADVRASTVLFVAAVSPAPRLMESELLLPLAERVPDDCELAVADW
jgi:hypothetical protein